jgi:hypothetical protein
MNERSVAHVSSPSAGTCVGFDQVNEQNRRTAQPCPQMIVSGGRQKVCASVISATLL